MYMLYFTHKYAYCMWPCMHILVILHLFLLFLFDIIHVFLNPSTPKLTYQPEPLARQALLLPLEPTLLEVALSCVVLLPPQQEVD